MLAIRRGELEREGGWGIEASDVVAVFVPYTFVYFHINVEYE